MYSECVGLIAFPQQQWLTERASILRYTSVACLVDVTVQLYKTVCCICATVSRYGMIGVVSGKRAGQPWNRSSISSRRKRSFFSPVSPDRLT